MPEMCRSTDPAALQPSAWPPGPEAVAPAWRPLLDAFWHSPPGERVRRHVQQRLAAGAIVYPPEPLRALRLTPPSDVRVLILGQDPYHGPGQANGLAFDVAPQMPAPRSLRNIFLELAREYGASPALAPGLLARWASQGVLLLNASFTVEAGQAASHSDIGWEALCSAIVLALRESERPLSILLWGNHAQARWRSLPAAGAERHQVLMASHPSPLSARRPPAPFIGCGHFRAVNDWRASRGERPIDWLG